MSDTQPPSSGLAEVNGTHIYYEVAGTGDPLVLVHAGIADSRMWDDQFHAFAEQYQVIRYDMRGFGQTPMVAGDFSHVADLRALLQSLTVDRAALVGCSKGGTIALDFTLEHPEMVEALVLVGSMPSGFEMSGDRPAQWDELVEANDRVDIERISELEVQIWVDGPQRGPDQVDARIRDKVRAMNLIALTAEAAALGSEQEPERVAMSQLGDVRAPTLVAYGDLDNPNIHRAAELMAQNIPGAKTAVIEGTAHVPNMERPDEFNRLVLEFLAGAK